MQKWKVGINENGIRLQDFLNGKCSKEFSHREIKRQIELNKCIVNGVRERFASKRLASGDTIQFDTSGLGQKAQKLEFEPHRILFEDNDLLVYDKPAGVTSDPSGILRLLKPHGEYILTHRLDKETSGILILAKNKKTEEAFLNAFREREIQKNYLALVDGVPKDYSGIIENRLGKISSFQGQTVYGRVSGSKGLDAITEWKLKKASKNVSLVECQPKTGRTHQIRVHLSQMGHPILGDYQYGKVFRSKMPCPRMMLHASSVKFIHPKTLEKMHIEAPIPEDFKAIMKMLW